MNKLSDLLKKLSRLDRHNQTEAREREATERIQSAGSQPPEEIAAWGPSATAPTTAPHHDEQAEGAPPAPARRLTAQERVAARALQTQGR
jgi:hypothetical protein